MTDHVTEYRVPCNMRYVRVVVTCGPSPHTVDIEWLRADPSNPPPPSLAQRLGRLLAWGPIK